MPTLQVILDWINLTLMVTGIFFAGVVWSRVSSLQERMERLASVSVLETRVIDLVEEMKRIRDRLDRFIDASAHGKSVI